ncbi:hypothetical protein N1851_034144 [Merluccius polli]|uniref:Uncharacterized protein n=1 Tax=Merluccius polli TaxID=89951 RepID=A0AA47M062_MERPO|nr:hypothetical protein N1851_034144 [Merluccius polli]
MVQYVYCNRIREKTQVSEKLTPLSGADVHISRCPEGAPHSHAHLAAGGCSRERSGAALHHEGFPSEDHPSAPAAALPEHVCLEWRRKKRATGRLNLVCYEFTRVVGKNLKENVFEALDRFSPNLMDLFRKKTGLSGQLLTDLLRQTKTTEPTDIRCLCLRGLPVVLGDDPSAFFKTCSDATDKDLYSETSVGILCIDEHPQLNPSRVSIILEGSVVMEELANLPQAFCVLFGLIYALHLDYPKCMKSTFHFIQQVRLNLSRVEAVVWAMGHGQDGRVYQLPYPRVALLLAGTEAQAHKPYHSSSTAALLERSANHIERLTTIEYLADHLDEVLGVLVSTPLELACAGVQRGGMGHNQHLVSWRQRGVRVQPSPLLYF